MTNELSFIYEESWRQDGWSYPLSLSMPLASAKELKRLNWTNPFDEEPSRN